MEFCQLALANKEKYYTTLNPRSLAAKIIVEKHIKEDYELKQLKREWEPGGGSLLFEILTKTQRIFLKAMSLNISVESKLEKEKSFIETPSIRNEHNFIQEVANKIGSENIPKVIFYDEIEDFGFLATEWLEPFEKIIESIDIEETIQSYNKIRAFTKSLFENNIVHTDIHEKNTRFRDKTPVIIDYGEARYLKQSVPFEKSLDYIGINKYGNVGKMPILNELTVEGYTCLSRLKKVYDKFLTGKLSVFSKECNFDNSCPYNKDIYQEPDPRIYQSVNIDDLKIAGHRPPDDERVKLVKKICNLYSVRYSNLIYIDIGSNIGNFCFAVSSLKRVVRSIGVEAFGSYLAFASGIKFILGASKVSFYNLTCGENDISQEIHEVKDYLQIKKFVSLMAVYHHLENKERCLEDIKQISPAGVIIEFATQDRYYPERKNWENESKYIKNKLNHRFSTLICRSVDYGRPIVIFTNDTVLYLAAECIKLYQLFKKNLRTLPSPLSFLKRSTTLNCRITTKNSDTSYSKAVEWLKKNRVKREGIPISSEKHISYPEVTGYTIPTLYQWGEKEVARDLTVWLMHMQNEDGSFSAPDGTPYTFDTGQVVHGFVAALDDLHEVEKPLRRACDWIILQVRIDGRLDTPSTRMWGNIADDRIHLFVLPPLIEAGVKLNEPKYIDAAYRVLEYYKQGEKLVEFNTLSHFYAYIIEALLDLGETDLAKRGMEQVVKLQKKDGSVPAYKNVSWVCSVGLAQFAVIWYKLGMRTCADKALEYLGNIQNRTGGFYGSYGKGANYFPSEEISWTLKFFLDAYHWKIKTAFNEETKVNIFPNMIDKSDGRVQEILSFFGDLSDKKVIDIGCGKGRFLRVLEAEFPNAKLYGLDISEKMLGFCPEGAKTVCGNILDIRYPNSYFDCVYCVETLEHALRAEIAIKELVRILKPGGKIIIIDKNIAKLGELELEPWEQWFEAEEITELLGQYGVETHYKPIAYGKKSVPDGLFIAWEGIRKHD